MVKPPTAPPATTPMPGIVITIWAVIAPP